MSELEQPIIREREGLPPGYRMRADEHYVDALESRRAGPIVRVIHTHHIESVELSPATASVTDIADSIAVHGILQPLLVRRSGGRYRLIAGRKRLAAALIAGINEVPCVVHDVDDEAAAALAEAANLRAAAQTVPPLPAATREPQLTVLDLAGGLAAAQREVARARRDQRPLTAVLFEMAGEQQLLAEAGDTLLRTVRESDLPIRLHDNELLVLLAGLDAAQARPVAERVRAVLQVSGRYRLSVSAAVAELAADDTVGTLVDRTREKVRAALARGHNRVA